MVYYYAVANGRQIGIFTDWKSCKQQVHGFSHANCKRFSSLREAQEYLDSYASSENEYDEYSYDEESYESSSYEEEEEEDNYDDEEEEETSSYIEVGSCESEDEMAFPMDEEEFIPVFTKGICWRIPKKMPRGGVGIWFEDGHPCNVSQPAKGCLIPEYVELQAARIAVEIAAREGIPKLRILTDSVFLVNCVNVMIQVWKARNWTNCFGEEVLYRDELLLYEKARKGIVVQVELVLPNTVSPGRKKAKKLAADAAK